MSAENVRKVIARAVSDGSFRERLFHSPDEAFSGYDLTEQERSSILAGLSKEGFDTLSSDLGDRVSRAGVHLGDLVEGVINVADEVGHMPPPIPHTEGEAGTVGSLPTPIPHTEGEAGTVGALPIPVPRPEGEGQGGILDAPEAGDDGGEVTPINLP